VKSKQEKVDLQGHTRESSLEVAPTTLEIFIADRKLCRRYLFTVLNASLLFSRLSHVVLKLKKNIRNFCYTTGSGHPLALYNSQLTPPRQTEQNCLDCVVSSSVV